MPLGCSTVFHGRRWCAALVLAAWLLPSPPTLADRKPKVEALNPAVRALLLRMEQAQSQVQSLQAEVEATHTLAVLAKPQVQKGVLVFERPGKVRWEYREPEQQIYVLADGKLTGYIPAKKRVARLNVARREGRIRKMFAIGQSAETLAREFQMSLAPHSILPGTEELVLIPDSRRVRKRIQEIHIWVDQKTSLPRQVLWRTGEGDEVRLRLDGVILNHALPAETFTVKIPPDAREMEGFSWLGMFGGDDLGSDQP